jgi:hypothetical protein
MQSAAGAATSETGNWFQWSFDAERVTIERKPAGLGVRLLRAFLVSYFACAVAVALVEPVWIVAASLILVGIFSCLLRPTVPRRISFDREALEWSRWFRRGRIATRDLGEFELKTQRVGGGDLRFLRQRLAATLVTGGKQVLAQVPCLDPNGDLHRLVALLEERRLAFNSASRAEAT